MTRLRVNLRTGSNDQDAHCWIRFAGMDRKIIRIWPDGTIEAAYLEVYTRIIWHTLINMKELKNE